MRGDSREAEALRERAEKQIEHASAGSSDVYVVVDDDEDDDALPGGDEDAAQPETTHVSFPYYMNPHMLPRAQPGLLSSWQPPGPGDVTTLVCLIGNIRGGPESWRSIRKRLVRPLNAHVAVLANYDTPHDLLVEHFAPTHIWRVPEYGNWSELLHELLPAGWLARIHPSKNVWGGLPGIGGSGAIIFALRLVLLRYLDALVGSPYQRLVLSRNDLFHACDHPPIWPRPGEVFTPDGVSKWGVRLPSHMQHPWHERCTCLVQLLP